MVNKLILINGPSGCGKDTASQFIRDYLPLSVQTKISAPLKRVVKAVFDLKASNVTYFEDHKNKDAKCERFYGWSYRQAQIGVSQWLNNSFGPDILGQMFLRAWKEPIAFEYLIISDAGVTEEIVPLVERWKPRNVLVIELERDGCTFNVDCRGNLSPVELSGVTFAHIYNQYNLELFKAQCERTVDAWISN